jgi:hypothetical protein
MTDVFDAIRDAARRVAESARLVRIDAARIASLAPELAAEPPPALDPAHHQLGDPATTLAYVVTIDAINFGSGWFPVLDKEPGLSGYLTIATRLKRHFEAEGAFGAPALAALDAATCADVLGQGAAGDEALELMELYAQSLRGLGRHLLRHHGGRFEGLVEHAGGSAARLVAELARMPLYRDVAEYAGRPVPFYKRAQITASDLAAAFDGRGYGHFDDLDALTLFADNLVPHVLRLSGVLSYAPELLGRIERGELLQAGSPEEVEIRACAVHAVEQCVAVSRAAGLETSARQLDSVLWTRGQDPACKAHPRHRARSPFY